MSINTFPTSILAQKALNLPEFRIIQGSAIYGILVDLYSTKLEADDNEMPIPAWYGMLSCNVAEPPRKATTELIRDCGLRAEHYSIGQVWIPEIEEEF